MRPSLRSVGWCGLLWLTALSACGTVSDAGSTATPDPGVRAPSPGSGGGSPPPTPPPAPDPPPTVDNLTVALHQVPHDDPLAGVLVRLSGGGAALEAITGADGVAHVDRLTAGDYTLTLDGLPAHVSASGAPASIHFGPFFPRDVSVALPLDLAEGPLVLFGDSDSMPDSPFRGDSIQDFLDEDPDLTAFFGWPFVARNRAQPDTPVADVSAADHYGLDQVRNALAELPDLRFALLRFGLNDVHAYLLPPTSDAVARFRDAYRAVLAELAARDVVPILVTLQHEKDSSRAGGTDAANGVIRELAAETGAVLVENDISYAEDPELFAASDPDGVHLNEDGHRHLAALTEDALLHYFTHGAFTDP